MFRLAALNALALTSLCLLACGPGPDPESMGEAEDLLSELAELYCDTYFRCGCGGMAESLHGSYQQCYDLVVASDLPVIEAAQDAGLTFDAACLQARTARFERLGCSPDWSETGSYVHCKTFFGTRAQAESCTSQASGAGDDCLKGLMCREGRCVDFEPRHREGEECFLEWPYCVDGSYCLPDGDVYRCIMPSQVGEPCSEDGTCFMLPCDPDTKVCEAWTGAGELCDPIDPTCDAELTCQWDADEMAATCVEEPIAGLGEGCGQIQCSDGLTCDAASLACVPASPYVCWGTLIEPLPQILPTSE